MAAKRRKKKKEKRTELVIGIGAIIIGLIGFTLASGITFDLGPAGRILAIFWLTVMGLSGIAVLAKDHSLHREFGLQRLQEELYEKYEAVTGDIPARPSGSRFIDIEGEFTADCWRRDKTLYLITSWGYLQPTLIDRSKKLFGPKQTVNDYDFIRHDIYIPDIKSCEIVNGKTELVYLEDGAEKKLILEERGRETLREFLPEYFHQVEV